MQPNDIKPQIQETLQDSSPAEPSTWLSRYSCYLPLILSILICYTLHTVYGYYFDAKVHHVNKLEKKLETLSSESFFYISDLEKREKISKIQEYVEQHNSGLALPDTPPIIVEDTTPDVD